MRWASPRALPPRAPMWAGKARAHLGRSKVEAASDDDDRKHMKWRERAKGRVEQLLHADAVSPQGVLRLLRGAETLESHMPSSREEARSVCEDRPSGEDVLLGSDTAEASTGCSRRAEQTDLRMLRETWTQQAELQSQGGHRQTLRQSRTSSSDVPQCTAEEARDARRTRSGSVPSQNARAGTATRPPSAQLEVKRG